MHVRPLFRLSVFAVALLASTDWVVAQTPDLRSVAGRPDLWPREVVTKAATAAGKTSTPIPAGTTMKVVGLEGPLINLDFKGALLVLPATQTDFVERAVANAATRPAPAAVVRPSPVPLPDPQPAAANPAAPSSPPLGGVKNSLGLKLAPDLLMFDAASKVEHLIPGVGETGERAFILLQFGGGRRWGGAMKELVPALEEARARGANLATILVPLAGSSVQSAIGLHHESSFAGPLVDPRKTATVDELWAKYGHSGTFALALIGPGGQIYAQTIPVEAQRTVDKFHLVLEALKHVPPR